MTQSTTARLEAFAAAGQDKQLSRDPGYAGLAPGTKCLALAARGGHLITMQLLLRHQAYTPPAAGFGCRDAAWRDLVAALEEAARHGHLLVTAALLSVSTKSDQSIAGDTTDCTALDAAAAGGHDEIVQLLCNSIQEQDPMDMTMRPVLQLFLAWDRAYAVRQGFSSFTWYSRIRPQFSFWVRVCMAALTASWAVGAIGLLPAAAAMWEHPLSSIIWALLLAVHTGM